jgi:inorganic triphosphatase YgiF
MSAPTPQEIELKLAVPQSAQAAVRERISALGAIQRTRLDTTYFDTPQRDLASRHAALRLRRLGRRHVQTLKTGDGERAMASRGEIELPLARAALDLPALFAAGAPRWFRDLDLSRLRPVFRTVFDRDTVLIDTGDRRVEIAFDTGHIEADDGGRRRRCPISEVEFELFGGTPAAMLELAERIAGSGDAALALLPLPASKAIRGERISRGQPPLQPLMASREAFSKAGAHLTFSSVLRAVSGLAADVVAANLNCLTVEAADQAGGADAALAIHQARVALRRLRSAVRLLGDRGDFPSALATRLASIARALGTARDLDVLATTTWPQIERHVAANDAAGGLVGAARTLETQLRARAAEARREAVRLARDAGTAAALRELLAYALSPEPRDANKITASRAAKLVERRCQRLIDAGRKFADLEPEAQHRVRILGKRARYAVELLAAHLPRKRTERLARALTRLQDRLGLLNDAEVALPYLLAMVDEAALAKALIDWRDSLRESYVEDAERELRAVRDALPLD